MSRHVQTNDIEGAHTSMSWIKAHPRGTDPNVPAYTLPTNNEPPPTPPKFVTDSVNVSDIQGTTSTSLLARPGRETSTGSCRDIRGTYIEPLRRPVRDNMHVEDINLKGRSVISSRSMNYDLQSIKDSKRFFIAGTKPVPQTRTRMDGVNYSLRT
eukprot:7179059-Pyramimonas_sp.AAC.1